MPSDTSPVVGLRIAPGHAPGCTWPALRSPMGSRIGSCADSCAAADAADTQTKNATAALRAAETQVVFMKSGTSRWLMVAANAASRKRGARHVVRECRAG